MLRNVLHYLRSIELYENYLSNIVEYIDNKMETLYNYNSNYQQ